MGYAITTRYVGPTNHRGSRVIATGPALTSGYVFLLDYDSDR